MPQDAARHYLVLIAAFVAGWCNHPISPPEVAFRSGPATLVMDEAVSAILPHVEGRFIVWASNLLHMRLRAKAVAEILQSKRVGTLYHANSVLAACEFLRAGALLSRGFVEDNKLLQTPQDSDEQDKVFGVWNDVFVDSVDIHDRISKKNSYGPVLFVFDNSLATLKRKWLWVTKQNPIHWGGLEDDERWFRSRVGLRRNFIRGEFSQMIVFRNCRGRVPFRSCLKEIILDDPKYTTPGRRNLYSVAFGALTLAKTLGRVKVTIKRRECRPGCRCVEEYADDRGKMSMMFRPEVV